LPGIIIFFFHTKKAFSMEKENNNSWQFFLETCISIKDTKTLNKFFDLLLTMAEKDELTNRLLIIDELLKNNLIIF